MEPHHTDSLEKSVQLYTLRAMIEDPRRLFPASTNTPGDVVEKQLAPDTQGKVETAMASLKKASVGQAAAPKKTE